MSGLISPGPGGGPLLLDFCECVCGIPPVYVITMSRGASYSASAGDPTATPPIPPGPDPYPAALAALTAASFTGSGASAYASLNQGTITLDYGDSGLIKTTTVTEINGSNLSDGGRSVFLQDLQYKLRVSLPSPWRGDKQITVYWRERTTHYSSRTTTVFYPGGVPPAEVTITDAGSISYADMSEVLMPEQGSLSVETSMHTVSASGLGFGDNVSVTGPKEIGQFYTRADTSFTGITVKSRQAAAFKNGFLPYVRPAVAASPQTVSALETATTAEGSTISYSGSQSVQSDHRIVVQGDSGAYVDNDLASTPPDDSAFSGRTSPVTGADDASLDTRSANLVTASQVKWPKGLIMTLSDEITTDELTAFVNAQISGLLAVDGSFILAFRNLPPDEISYAAKKSQYQASLALLVDAGLESIQPGGSLLVPATGTVEVAVDLLTVDLDMGIPTDSVLTFDFSFDASTLANSGRGGASAVYEYILTKDPVDVPIPSSNSRITFSNARVTTTTLNRWQTSPQAVVGD